MRQQTPKPKRDHSKLIAWVLFALFIGTVPVIAAVQGVYQAGYHKGMVAGMKTASWRYANEARREAGETTLANQFRGYGCVEDCSGHEAGYAWAKLHTIKDPDDCGGKSQSFREGCMAWAEEN